MFTQSSIKGALRLLVLYTALVVPMAECWSAGSGKTGTSQQETTTVQKPDSARDGFTPNRSEVEQREEAGQSVLEQIAPDSQLRSGSSTRYYAILIGCTAYPKLGEASQLNGPANDVKIISELLQDARFGFRNDDIVTLLYQNPADGQPTYSNIVREFERLCEQADAGDEVLVFLGGHTGQQANQNPDNDAESDELDEVFFAQDASELANNNANSTGVFTDDQLHAWVARIASRGAHITLVADRPSLFDDLPDSAIAYYAVSSEKFVAMEQPLPANDPNAQVHGRIAYAIYDCLRNRVNPITFRELGHYLRHYFDSRGWGPSPTWEGKQFDRVVFGKEVWPHRSAVLLSKFGKPKRVEISAGHLDGVRAGDIFRVLPLAGEPRAEMPVGYVRADSIRATSTLVSQVELEVDGEELLGQIPDTARCELVYRDFGDMPLTVGINGPDSGLPTRDRLARVERVLREIELEHGGAFCLAEGNKRVDVMATVRLSGVGLTIHHDDTDSGSDASVEIPFDSVFEERLLAGLSQMARANSLVRLGDLERTVGWTENLGGSPIQLDIQTEIEDPLTGGFIPLDIGSDVQLRDGDRVRVAVTNNTAYAVDVAALWVQTDFAIAPLSSGRNGRRIDNRLQPGDEPLYFGVRINDSTVGVEHLVIIAVRGGKERLDLSYLRQRSLQFNSNDDAQAPDQGADQPFRADLANVGSFIFGGSPLRVDAQMVRRLSWTVVKETVSAELGYGQTIRLFEQALELSGKLRGQQDPVYVSTLDSLSRLYCADGQYDKALSHFQKALVIAGETVGRDHPDYAAALHNIAWVHRAMGHSQKSIPLVEEALSVLENSLGHEHPRIATCLHFLGTLRDSMGNQGDALSHFDRAQSIMASHIARSSIGLTESQHLELVAQHQAYLYAYLDCAVRSSKPGSSCGPSCYSAVLQWKGAAMIRQRGIRLLTESPEIGPQFEQLRNVTRLWSALSLESPAPEIISDPIRLAAHRQQISRLFQEKSELEANISRRVPAYEQLSSSISSSIVVDVIPHDAALVDFVEIKGSPGKGPSSDYPRQSDGDRLLAFILRPGDEIHLVDLGPSAQLASLINTWRETFGESSDSKQAGQFLRNRIWDPILPHIADAITVLISPDGMLGRLPFAALPGKQPDTYLIEEYQIVTVPVPQLITDYLSETGLPAAPRQLLLIGDVDFDGDPATGGSLLRDGSAGHSNNDKTWEGLDGTRDEVVLIKDLFAEHFELSVDQIVDLRKSQATETAFLNFAPQCRILHVATHGFFAPPSHSADVVLPHDSASSADLLGLVDRSGQAFSIEAISSPGLLSGLVFAGANRMSVPTSESARIDNGYLTADEIATIQLNATQIVVLSACETGLGEVIRGEGILGLQRAFQIAGVKTTVTSLWNVNDFATRAIMVQFYRNLLEKKMSATKALREAQLWALNNPTSIPRGGKDEIDSSARLSPKFWAAWVLSGDWR